jgi:hypothetical protein
MRRLIALVEKGILVVLSGKLTLGPPGGKYPCCRYLWKSTLASGSGRKSIFDMLEAMAVKYTLDCDTGEKIGLGRKDGGSGRKDRECGVILEKCQGSRSEWLGY